MQEGDKMLLAPGSPFLVSPDAPEPAFLTLQAAHFLARLGPRSDSRDSSQSASRAEPRREREGDTWPGGCNLSIARTRDTDTPVTNGVRRSAAQIYCGFFGKAFPFQLPRPGWRGRDTIIAGISCAGHNSNTCGEHFQVTNILQ